MIKILTYIPTWKRPKITRLCYTGLKRAYKAAPDWLEFRTLIVASNDQDAALAQEFGFDVFRYENKPLGRKFNAGIQHAMKWDWDYLFQLNSDDLLSTDFWALFAPYIEKRLHYFGVDRVYFYDSETRHIKNFQYMAGCGIRFIRWDLVANAGIWNKTEATKKKILSRTNNTARIAELQDGRVERFELWENNANAGLDTCSDVNIILRTNYAQRLVRSKVEQRPVVVDIKSETNIHPFAEFRHSKTVSGDHRRQVLRRFPELMELEKRINA